MPSTMSRFRIALLAAAAALLAGLLLLVTTVGRPVGSAQSAGNGGTPPTTGPPSAGSSTSTPSTGAVGAQAPGAHTLHEASNDNFTADGHFAPGDLGFNLAEVVTYRDLMSMPQGIKALVWLGRCDGATPGFAAAVQPFLNSSRVFGYYLLDEPDPNGRWKDTCPAANLAAESDWIHRHDPGKQTFFLMMNLGKASHPDYTNRGDAYTPANTHIDLVGIDPYPCRAEIHGCAMGQIPMFVDAATSIGWSKSQIVPVYQAFGGGTWTNDMGAQWLLPTAAQASEMLADWQKIIPNPVFDQVYSWGSQRDDVSLEAAPKSLQDVFAAHNAPPPEPAPAPHTTAAGAAAPAAAVVPQPPARTARTRRGA